MKYGFITILFFFTLTSGFSQQKSFDTGKKYIIGNIEVTGNQSFNELTVIAFTGLKPGEEIFIPGERLSSVIKKLWEQNLFSDVNIYVSSIEGDVANLEINISELQSLNEVHISGIRRGQIKDILKETDIKKGQKITQNLLTTTENYIANKYRKKGFLNTQVHTTLKTAVSDSLGNEISKDIHFEVDKGNRVKISKIIINGNQEIKSAKLRRNLKNTKQKRLFRLFKASKYVKEDFEEDKSSLINFYKENGYRDARILSDSIVVENDKRITLYIDVEEGNKHYFGDIRFIGNSAYSDQELRQLLGIQKGDVYNGVHLQKMIDDFEDPDANSLVNLYQNSGYLFSSVNPVEVAIVNDTIDFEIRIREGNIAYFNNVTISGNDRTNDHVVYREIRVRPGQRYSKANVIRSIRELSQLGFFDPQTVSPNILNPDPYSGTVDIDFGVEEKGASQIELQGGYGGGGFVGTLGLSFNNFSMRNLFRGEAFKPLPMGDGQKLSLRAQASTFYQTYSLSFTEPWLGGKKPIQFNTSFSHTIQYGYNYFERKADKDRRIHITGASVGLAKRLKWPDDYFVLSHAIMYQHYALENFAIGGTGIFSYGNIKSNNLSYTIGLSRNNTHNNPIFPVGGSDFSITAKLTPPYSLFNGVDYKNLGKLPEYQHADGRPDENLIAQKRFDWLEYYKIKFRGNWYTNLIDKFVIRSHVEFGYLGAYNLDRGSPPFERFFMGGDGLGAFSLDGREIIALRGYPNQSLSNNDGNTIFNKYTLELRYPVTLKQMASIFALGFVEAGATYGSFKEYNPFKVYRSTGLGIRIFMPAFGMLGIDFGYGFDRIPGTLEPNGWETHFIIGQQF